MADENRFRKAGTARTRIGRYSGRNQIYHVSTATFERRPIFDALKNGRIVVQAIKCADDAGHSRTLAFVVMPDHLHWLFQLGGSRSLSGCMCLVKSYASRGINAASGRAGRIWQRGYYDRAIRKDEDLATVARYIVANPLRAGIVPSISQYPLWDAKWV